MEQILILILGMVLVVSIVVLTTPLLEGNKEIVDGSFDNSLKIKPKVVSDEI